MCTIVHVVLPPAADADGVGTLTEELKVGRGLREARSVRHDLTAAGMLRDREQVYMIVPWKNCHCGWSPARFAALAQQALDRGYAIAVGLLLFEDGGPADDTRRETVRPNVFAKGAHDEGDVLYIVEPDRSPPKVVPRHGPARKRRKAP